MKNKNFLKKLAAITLGFVMTLGVGAAGYAASASETRAKNADDYTIGTTILSSVSDGDTVVWGSSSKGYAYVIESNWVKLKTKSSLSSSEDFIIFTVEKPNTGNGFYLKNGTQYVNYAEKKIGYGTKTMFYFASGYTGTNSDRNGVLVSSATVGSTTLVCTYNSSGLRPYKNNFYSDKAYLFAATQSGKQLSSIAVKTAPTKTTYDEGESFDPSGLVITKRYSDSTTEDFAYADHTTDFTFNPSLSTSLTTSNSSVTITVGGKDTTQNITVNALPKYTVKYALGDGSGSSFLDTQVPTSSSFTIPSASGITCPEGKQFKNWTGSNGQSYSDGATIPANTFAQNATLTLTANYEDKTFENDTGYISGSSYFISDGELYFVSNGTSNPGVTTDASEATAFVIELVADNTFTLKNGSDYLYSNSTGSGSVKVGTGKDTIKWSFAKNSSYPNYFTITSQEGKYLSCYNETSFRCYASLSQASADFVLKLVPAIVHNLTVSFNDSLSYVGDSTTVSATCSESDETGLTFTSSNSGVLSVNGTTVTAVGTGSATISASSTCGGSGTSNSVTISARSASIPESKNVDVGADSETLSVTWNPSSPVPSGTITYLWSTTNSSVASLSSTTAASPTLSYGAAGLATISCKVTVNGKEFTTNNCSVTVNSTEPTLSWVDNYHPTTGYTGVGYTFKAAQQNIKNTQWSWKVDDSSVTCFTDNYTATFTSAGTYTVSVTCSNSQDSSITKTITETIEISVSSISISFDSSSTSASIDLGGTFDITPILTASGSYTSTQEISVQSNNTSICTVDKTTTTSGNKVTVTGVGSGTTTIKFNTTGASEASFEISVVNIIKDTITSSDLAATSTGYVTFSNVQKTTNGPKYAGASSKQSNGNIGIRTSSNSGIISTISGGTVAYVEVDLTGMSTTGRTLDVYGSNNAYTSIDDLFTVGKQGTVVGQISSNSSGTVRITFNDSYNYVGVRSNDSAFNFKSITIAWIPVNYGTTQRIEISNEGDTYFAVNDSYSNANVVVSKVDEEGNKLVVPNDDTNLSFSIQNNYQFTIDDVPSVTNTVTFIDENSQQRTASFTVHVSSLAKHKLVTYSEAPTDWSGKYLITASHPDTNSNMVLNASMSNIDESGDYVFIEPSSGIINCGTFYEVEINSIPNTNNYSIKLGNGKYMAGHSTSTENGYTFSNEPLANSISIDSDGFVHITSNSKELLFNKSTSADRFRYYKSSGTEYAEIKLYKYFYEESDAVKDYVGAINTFIDISNPSVDDWNDIKETYFDGLIKGADLEYLQNVAASNDDSASDASKAMYIYDYVVSYFNSSTTTNYENYLSRTVSYHKYTINWLDDNDTPLKTAEKLEYGDTPTAPSDPTKAKDAQYTYTFAGWSNSKGGTVLSSIPNVTSDATYYAVYSTVTNKYQITFKYPNVSGNIEVDEVEYGTKPSCSVIPTKDSDAQYSYTFAGWSTTTTSETIYANDDLPEVTGNQTYYARFTPTLENAKVTFMNGDKKYDETFVKVGESLSLSGYTPTKDGYTLTGWVDQDNNSYAASASIQNISKDLTLTAVWDANSYTVTFDVNGGNSLPASEATKTVTYNTALGELPTPTRDHYVFVGWFTASTAGYGKQVDESTIFEETKDTTYYAQWSYVYDIVLDVNADDAQGGALSSSVYHVSGEEQTITVTDPTREGYHLTGYKVTDDLEVKDGVLTIPANKGGKITLTAQWEANPHTVTLKYSDSDVQVIDTSYDAKFDLSEYARTEEGSYMVWKDQNGNYYDADEILTIKGDLVLTAEWRDIAVSIDTDVGFQFTGLDITKFEFIFTGTYDGDNVTEYGFLISKDVTALNNCVSANATEYDGVTTFVCDDGEAECVAGVKTENSSRVYYVTFYMIDAQGTHYTQVIAISIDEYLLSDDFNIESIDDPYAKIAIQVYIASLENNVNQGE